MTNPQLPDIDWAALLRELDPEDVERQQGQLAHLLDHRARQYASPLKQRESLAEIEGYDVLTFQLGRERYALPVTAVRGVRSITHVTRVPGVPPFYRGVVNIRGQIWSVLDLRAFFGIATQDAEESLELILVSAGGLEIGLLAQHIEEVTRIPKTHIEPIDMHYAFGMTAAQVVVLDIETLFSDERLMVEGES